MGCFMLGWQTTFPSRDKWQSIALGWNTVLTCTASGAPIYKSHTSTKSSLSPQGFAA